MTIDDLEKFKALLINAEAKAISDLEVNAKIKIACQNLLKSVDGEISFRKLQQRTKMPNGAI